MSAIDYTLVLEQGTTFDQTVTLKNVDGSYKDLTGYSARLQVRESADATATILSLTSPSVAALGIDLGTTNGQVRLRIPAATTAAQNFFICYYDLEIVAGSGEVTRVLKGKCILSREITK